MFKKRGKRKRRNIRETTKDLGDDEDISKTLSETRFLQKHRGIKARGLKGGIEEPEEEEEESNQQEEPTAHFLGAYQQGVKDTTEDEKEIKYMKIYIEDELKKRRGQDTETDSGEAETSKRKLDPTEEMLKKINEEGKVQQKRGGEENWAAGITEIPLPISVKLRNIEETERAKAKLLSGKKDEDNKKSKKRRGRDGDVGNFNSNFNRHQRDYAERMREKRKMRAGPEKPQKSGSSLQQGEKVPFSTDDRIVAKFIKRNRYR